MKHRFMSLYALALVPALLFVGCGDDQTGIDTIPPLAPVIQGANLDQSVVAVWWQPNVEPDLAGYNLYVEHDGQTRLHNSRPLVTPYETIRVDGSGTVRVYVTAVDYSGNESSPSASRSARELDVPPGDVDNDGKHADQRLSTGS